MIPLAKVEGQTYQGAPNMDNSSPSDPSFSLEPLLESNVDEAYKTYKKTNCCFGRAFQRLWNFTSDRKDRLNILEKLAQENNEKAESAALLEIPFNELMLLSELNDEMLNNEIKFYNAHVGNKLDPSKVSREVFAPAPARAIDNLMLAFDYFSANHQPNNAWEAMNQLQVYAGIIIGPILIAAVVDEVFDVYRISDYHHYVTVGCLIGLVLTCVVALKFYKTCRPIPQNIKPFRNYTVEVINGKINPLTGRDHIINSIFHAWASSSRTTRLHPLLVGEAGVGKTSIMMEVARRLATGDVPDSIKKKMRNMKLFGGPASLLLPSNPMFETDDKIDVFLRRIDPIKSNIILGLDEIHVFLNEEYGPRYSEILKSMLDASFKGLPYLICATTKEEYQKHIAGDASRARRFHVVYVDPLLKEEVLLVLENL